MTRLFQTTLLLIGCFALSVTAQAQEQAQPLFPAALAYHTQHLGDALLIYQGDNLLLEAYTRGYDGQMPHMLVSATKSFGCALAVLAVDDGLIDLDTPVAEYIPQWQDDPEREAITTRQLLTQTSGVASIEALLHGADVTDKSTFALRFPLPFAPGEQFQYGSTNAYIFETMLQNQLQGEDVGLYLATRLLVPLGLDLSQVLLLRDPAGNPNLAAGLLMTAQDWAAYGRLILQGGEWDGERLLDPLLLRECFVGTEANPYYGFGWWLQYDLDAWESLDEMALGLPEPGNIPAGVVLGETQPQVFIAAGQGRQRMFLFPSTGQMIVRFGQDDADWDDAEFLQLYLREASVLENTP